MTCDRFVIHIGRHKTGSTAIQLFLNRNKDALESRGYFFPTPLELHADLAVQIMYEQGTPLPPDISHRFECLNDVGNSPTEKLRSQLVEIGKDRVCLLTSEGFCNVSPNILERHFSADCTSVIVYIREQLSYLLSAYAQAIQETKRTYSFEEFEKAEYLDYSYFLNLWKRVYGDRLVVRLYDQEYLVHGDARKDFLECLGIEDSRGFVFPTLHANPSIGGALLQFKLLLNSVSPWPVEKLMPRTYRLLGNLAAADPLYREQLKISESLAVSVRGKYKEINFSVMKQYFPQHVDGNELFSLKSENYVEHEEKISGIDFQKIMEYFKVNDADFYCEHIDILSRSLEHFNNC